MIASMWGVFWAIFILVICAAQIWHKGNVADPKREEGILAFIAIFVVVALQLVAWLIGDWNFARDVLGHGR